MDEVLTQVIDTPIDVIGLERGFPILIDPDTTNLNLHPARNIERETLKWKDIEISQTGSALKINRAYSWLFL